MSEPAVAWSSAAVEAGVGPAATSGPARGAGPALAEAGRPAPAIAREAESARRDFHRAASPGGGAGAGAPAGRSHALQAFVIANTGRGLLPAGETSGVLSPNLKTEES